VADDANWPRASAWLAGDHLASATRRLGVLGAPLTLGSITPGRCDLAPEAIRKALHRFSTYDFDSDVDVRSLHGEDLGNVQISQLTPEAAFEPLSQAVRAALEGREALVLLGGDNSITRPGLLGLGLHPLQCGLLTFDAHLDLRDLDAGLSNGNPVRALLRDGLQGDHVVQIGIQSFANSPQYAEIAKEEGIRVISADEVRRCGIEKVVSETLESFRRRVDVIYVDLDLDVMDRMFVPGTPGSRPGGLTPAELRAAAHLCGMNPMVRIMDLVEFDPTHDIADTTALTAAACLLSFASGVARRP